MQTLITTSRIIAVPLLLIVFVPMTVLSNDAPRASYFKNGELHVNVLGSPETKPLTSGPSLRQIPRTEHHEYD